MVRRSGIPQKLIAERMNISVPTLRKYLAMPETMTGIRRKQLAKVLRADIRLMDAVANSPQSLSIEDAENLVEQIKPNQHEKVHH